MKTWSQLMQEDRKRCYDGTTIRGRQRIAQVQSSTGSLWRTYAKCSALSGVLALAVLVHPYLIWLSVIGTGYWYRRSVSQIPFFLGITIRQLGDSILILYAIIALLLFLFNFESVGIHVVRWVMSCVERADQTATLPYVTLGAEIALKMSLLSLVVLFPPTAILSHLEKSSIEKIGGG